MEYMDILPVISAVYAIVAIYGTGYILYRFAKPFMKNKKERSALGSLILPQC